MSARKDPFHVWDCTPKFRFRCPTHWDALTPTAEPDVRHCGACRRDVYLCRTPDAFVEHGQLGRCVAVPQAQTPEYGLGEPSFEEVLRRKADADLALAWWDGVAAQASSLPPGQWEKVEEVREQLGGGGLGMSPECYALMKRAVSPEGLKCPHCGSDLIDDQFGVMILLGTGQCEHCRKPIDLTPYLAPD